jgi:peptidylprolyl isomerase
MKAHGLLLAVALALAAAPALSRPKAAAPPPAPAGPPAPSGPTEADWRTPDPQNVIVIDTSKGRIIVELTPEAAPQHAARIRELTRQGLYNGRQFFRVINDFMDQTGDPLDNGTGQSQLPDLQPEFTFKRDPSTPFVSVGRNGGQEIGFVGPLPVISQTMDLALLTVDHRVNAYGAYCRGVLGAARSDDPASANSQFFLMRTNSRESDHGTHSLDQKYTAFGRIIAGQDIVDSIAVGEPPAQPDKMLTVRVLADIPAAERPKVRVLDPRGPWFKQLASQVMAQKVVGASICDFDLPSEVK